VSSNSRGFGNGEVKGALANVLFRIPAGFPTGNDAAWFQTGILPARTAGDDGADDDDASHHGADGRDDGQVGRGE
jgi:hypothetical protein